MVFGALEADVFLRHDPFFLCFVEDESILGFDVVNFVIARCGDVHHLKQF